MAGGLARLLCVDDEPAVLELLSQYFAEQGFVVHTAANGLEAVAEVKRWTPRAVILDLFMPRLGGLGALDRIRRVNPGVSIILIGGDAHALELASRAGVGVAGVFAKPLALPEILKALAEAGVTPARTAEAGPASRPDAGRLRPRRRVLVVDDQVDVGQILVEYLQSKGFTAAHVNSGEQALERAPEFQPHFVLLDIAMPGLGGVETLPRIKSVVPDTCVIMVSANQDAEVARCTLAMGATDYIPKPVDFGYLDSVLEIHMSLGGSTVTGDRG